MTDEQGREGWADPAWMGELHPEARTNVSVQGFGPLCRDRWCAFLVHPDGHTMAAFYEPAAREITLTTGFSWPMESRFRAAVRESAKQLLNMAMVRWAELRFDDETETIDDRYDP
jgi:hypothetical protein